MDSKSTRILKYIRKKILQKKKLYVSRPYYKRKLENLYHFNKAILLSLAHFLLYILVSKKLNMYKGDYTWEHNKF